MKFIFWIVRGTWWPFVVWVIVAAVWGSLVSRYYFNHVKYICPECHEIFKPALLFSQGDTENALKALKITEETAAAALPSVQAAAAFDFGMMAMNVLERVLAMLLHIGLTVIVYYGVINGKKLFLSLAILLHMLMDTFPALYQRGVVQLWMVEIWAALWTAVIGFIAVRQYGVVKE